jgi:geranylgeranylglycerol-phosphate geranylgeranyltransferase
MIINDIFDINIDKQNNPTRPLVTGEIKKFEACVLSLFFLFATETLNVFFIPQELRFISNIANLIIYIYTPILKRIPIIKNVSCSLLVSLGILFTGLCALPIQGFLTNDRYKLLTLASQLIFTGSIYNELLLDIADKTGDKQNNIYTVPIIFGNKKTLRTIADITILNVIFGVIYLMNLFDIYRAIVLVFFFVPLFKKLLLVDEFNYSKEIIKYSVSKTVMPMVALLFYLCLLSLSIGH